MSKKKIINWVLIIIGTIAGSILITVNIISLIETSKLNPNVSSYFVLSKTTLIGCLILSLICILSIIRYTMNVRNKLEKGDLKKAGHNEFGSSRFATVKEIEKEFSVWNFNKKIKAGGMVVTKINNKYYYDDSTNHSLIIGSTGSGKTVSAIMPLIYNLADASESMIINDSKGEILRETYGYLKDKDYNIKIINLRDPYKSDGWNPLHLPYKYFKQGNIEKEVEIVNDFSYSICQEVSARDPYWSESSSAVLSGLALGIIEDSKAEDEVHFNSIYNMLVYHGTKNAEGSKKNSLDDYFDNKPFGNLAKNFYATGGFAKGETRATIFSVLSSKLRIFSDLGIASMTSKTNFELEDIGKEKTAVFLIIPDEKEARHVLASLFVDQCYQSLVTIAQEQKDNKLPIRVNFVLDEFANMPPIKNFSNKITVSRGRNIRFYLIIQDFDQLKEKYKDQAGTIKSNCNNWLYLLTADNNTASEISKRLGKYTIEAPRVSTSNKISSTDFNISNDISLMGRDLLTSDELMKFNFGEGLFMKTRMNPIESILPIINDFPIDFKQKSITYPKPDKYKIELFNLDSLRLEWKAIDKLGPLVDIDRKKVKLTKIREDKKVD
ncbi:MAG: type IV secretory system conjugative DNA transfer family protein [Bacilli bacterium]|nr:type IV secretory system conjugative DNA transfer family protein [Bacilli bacterium]